MLDVPSMTPRKIKLDVVSDLICPWCYVGHIELLKAIEQVRLANLAATFEIQYHPFILHPSLTPSDSLAKEEWFIQKVGDEKFAELKKLLAERTEKEGIKFTFAGVIQQTVSAHRLLQKAWQLGGQDAQQKMLKQIFKAYFEQAKSIGDIDVLAQLAEDAGISSKEEAEKFLKTNELEAEVKTKSDEAQRKGIAGVPFVVIDGRWAVSGGQSPDVYFKIFEKLVTVAPAPSKPQPVAPTASATA